MNNSNLIIFTAELLGTFGLLTAATGSIVYDGSLGFSLGMGFIAAIHFIGLTIVIFLFGKYSMAHFNPAVTIGFAIAGYLEPKKIPIYFSAQLIGALLGTLFVRFVFGNHAKLGLNFPNYYYSLETILGVEILATVFLMGGILLVVGLKKLPMGVVSSIIGCIVALDVFFFGPISGASMNPIRSLSPALVTGILDDLWIYWTMPFLGSIIVSLIYRKKFLKQKIPQ